MNYRFISTVATAALFALAGCGNEQASAPTEQPEAAAAASAPTSAPAEKSLEGVRAPAPPPPAGGGKAAPEIAPDVLKKIQDDLAKKASGAKPPASGTGG